VPLAIPGKIHYIWVTPAPVHLFFYPPLSEFMGWELFGQKGCFVKTKKNLNPFFNAFFVLFFEIVNLVI